MLSNFVRPRITSKQMIEPLVKTAVSFPRSILSAYSFKEGGKSDRLVLIMFVKLKENRVYVMRNLIWILISRHYGSHLEVSPRNRISLFRHKKKSVSEDLRLAFW
jgi:hypothetical protein